MERHSPPSEEMERSNSRDQSTEERSNNCDQSTVDYLVPTDELINFELELIDGNKPNFKWLVIDLWNQMLFTGSVNVDGMTNVLSRLQQRWMTEES